MFHTRKMRNIPNIITAGRLAIAVSGFFMMFMDFWVPAFFTMLASVLLDAVDGNIARRLNQVSEAGVFFDIMTDKIVIIGTFLITGVQVRCGFVLSGSLDAHQGICSRHDACDRDHTAYCHFSRRIQQVKRSTLYGHDAVCNREPHFPGE